MIGIVGAMAVETEALIAVLKNTKKQEIAGLPFVSGLLDGTAVTVVTCGPGKVFAACATQILIDRFAPDCIINSGVAGTLSPKLGIGDLAIARAVVQHDMDTSAFGDPVGLISHINKIELSCDSRLVSIAAKAADTLHIKSETGVIATGDAFICNAEKKKWISDTFSAVSCEMEGGAVGHCAFINAVPFLVLRVISDGADGEAPENFELFCKESAEKSIAVLKAVIAAYAEENQ